jgi:hypothetical protein
MLAYDWDSPYEDAAIGYEMLRVDYDSALAYDGPFPYGGSLATGGVNVYVGLNTNTSFVAELNRLANDGYYPERTAYLTATRAANVWAGTNGLTLIAALNYINNRNTSQPTGVVFNSVYVYNEDFPYGGNTPLSQWLPLLAVCNAIAGTTNKSSADALGSIE